MADFRINLAKTVASSPEERRKFYNGMLIYFVACAAAMVGVAYFTSANLMNAFDAAKQRRILVKTMTSVSAQSQSFFKNPDRAYQKLAMYDNDLAVLKQTLAGRTHFLPVISQLFAEIPDGVRLENLSASAKDKKITFGLLVPPVTPGNTDPLRKLQKDWNENADLRERLHTIRQPTSERRTDGGQVMKFVKFECILKQADKMDVGKFKASKRRLMAWIVIPPVIIVGVGLSAFALQERAQWRLQQTQSLSDVLPPFIQSQREASELVAGLGLGDEDRIGTEDQLITELNEAAYKHGFTVDSVRGKSGSEA
jgi:hypothetical protein